MKTIRCLCVLIGLLFLAQTASMAGAGSTATPAPSATPQANEQGDATTENDPVSAVKTITLQATYTGATYGPGSFRISQIIPRVATFYVGKSLLRISLPRLQTINGLESGFGDTQFFYLFQRPVRAGLGFVGVSGQFPTASSPLLGTGKWLLGPAAAYIFAYQPRKAIAGVLLQTAFTIAGSGARSNQSAITFLPFASYAIGHGWFLKWAEGPWLFDLQRGASLIPIGAGIGRIIRAGNAVLVSISDEGTVIHGNIVNAPKNTVRLTFTIFVRGETGVRK